MKGEKPEWGGERKRVGRERESSVDKQDGGTVEGKKQDGGTLEGEESLSSAGNINIAFHQPRHLSLKSIFQAACNVCH
jgi:hypothetical protein